MTLAMAEWEVGNLALSAIDSLKAAVRRDAILGQPKKKTTGAEQRWRNAPDVAIA